MKVFSNKKMLKEDLVPRVCEIRIRDLVLEFKLELKK